MQTINRPENLECWIIFIDKKIKGNKAIQIEGRAGIIEVLYNFSHNNDEDVRLYKLKDRAGKVEV